MRRGSPATRDAGGGGVAEAEIREVEARRGVGKAEKRRCTPAEIEALNRAMHVFCNEPRRCSPQADTCESATAKVAAGYGCAEARVVLRQRCFRKGDPGYEDHMEQLANVYAALRRCEKVMAEKCN